eukprot:TRINITY_DN76379_c0_g1_i1.p1 TRINITY_DN76379_c0_g1~~TRINITY_DN76379_c0_g1_i1.p1  ORF type:complete len:325 (+),score=42.07 TRINITY_DN76379_c0_g1_i1:153-1127(+)
MPGKTDIVPRPSHAPSIGAPQGTTPAPKSRFPPTNIASQRGFGGSRPEPYANASLSRRPTQKKPSQQCLDPISGSSAPSLPSYNAAHGLEGLEASPPVGDAITSEDLDMMTGVVKNWCEERGFGFIAADGGTEDVFVHRSVLKDGDSLVEGNPVMFDLVYDTDRMGFRATKCVGAVAAPIRVDDVGVGKGNQGDAAIPNRGGKGSKSLPGFFDPSYRSTFVQDPWVHLYPAAVSGSHLSSYLEEERHRPSAASTVRTKPSPRKPDEGCLEVDAMRRHKPTGAATSEQLRLPGPSSVDKTEKKASPPDATSIYDFFHEGGDEMLL